MKTIKFIFLFLFCSSVINGQEDIANYEDMEEYDPYTSLAVAKQCFGSDDIYTKEDSTAYYSYTLFLFSSGNYILNYYYSMSLDMKMNFPISMGKYQRKDNLLMLKDKLNKSALNFYYLRSGNLRSYSKIFKGLQNMVLQKTKKDVEDTDFYCSIDTLYYQSTIEWRNQQRDSISSDTVYHKLYYEEYGGLIKFIEPMSYEYCLFGKLFSRGTFTRVKNTNKLILYDKDMNFNFICYVSENAVFCNIIPPWGVMYRCGYSPNEIEWGYNVCDE